MAKVSVYLNFMGKTEEAFNFYKDVFGTEFVEPMQRMGEVPQDDSQPALPENEKKYDNACGASDTGRDESHGYRYARIDGAQD